MSRYYRFSKLISEPDSEVILKEINELENVDKIEITPDHQYLIVRADDSFIANIMSNVVNICSRAVNGLEISFSRFAE